MSKGFTFFTYSVILSLLVYSCHVSAQEAFDVSAKAAILIDGSSGQVLYEKNADLRMPMASTTKIMTAITAVENSKLGDVAKASLKAVSVEGSSMYLKADETITIENLLYGLMLRSGNDAANVIAEHIAGSSDAFATLMNKKAAELGLSNSNFKNPNGLDDKEHYTTAFDLAKIAAYGLKNPTFCEISKTKSKKIERTTESGFFYLTNHNKLLSMYPFCDGGKTGFTKKSGRCLVSWAYKDGLRLIAVTLDAPNDWSDHTKLFDYGFNSFQSIKLTKGKPVAFKNVKGGEHQTVELTIGEDFYNLIKKDETYQLELTTPLFVNSPVRQGDMAGYITVMKNNEQIKLVPVVFAESVSTLKSNEKNGFLKLLDWITKYFKE